MNRPFSTREKVLLVVLVVLVMCICYFKLLLEPINDSIADYQMKASAEQDEIVANTALLTKMNNMKKELAEIYAAREQNTMGISSADLARNIPGSVYCSTLDKVTAQLRELARPGDLILTVGAGDIYRAGEKLLKEGKN